MLQYPVQLPPLSLSSSTKLSAKDNIPYSLSNDPARQPQPLSSLRFQKDPYVSRPVGHNRLPAPVVPLSISTNLVPSPSASSPSTASAKHPRSPYISSRQLSSSPVPFRQPQSGPAPPSALSQCASVGSYPIEDVLVPGDIVGEGLFLQDEVLQLVGPNNKTDSAALAQEFEVVRVLGTGSYAVVYLVKEVLSRAPPSEDGHMSTIGSMDLDGAPQTLYGREFAIKLLSKANLDEEALTAQMSEVTIHQSLPLHSNIVTLHRTLETPSFLLLLLEYVPGEDLFYFLEQARDHYEPQPSEFAMFNSRTPPTPSLLSNLHPSQLLSRTRLRLIASMFAQMCDAVATCHSQQVFHRDIKPENFIVTDGWFTSPSGCQERKVVVKLTDFGLSTTDVESSDVDCGSAPYMSYECRNNIAPTYSPRAADVWSLGIVLINMLYHINPWTDTADGACSTFDLYRRDPINFFVNRFSGMTRGVAEFLAHKVFCTLENDEDDRRRISAAEFGTWVKNNLVTMLSGHGMQRTLSTSSTHGYPITSIPVSHRPMSRNPSNATAARGTPAMPTRSLSRAPSLGPAYEREEKSELSTVVDQDNEDDADAPGTEPSEPLPEFEEAASRSASTSKRRKRGARKGKGGQASVPTSPQDDTIVNLAVASESLARELSKQSKAPSSVSTTSRKSQPREPVSMYAMPTPLLNTATSRSTTTNDSTSTVLSASIPPSAPTKKPSRWKLSFGKANASTLTNAERPPPVVDEAPTAPADSSPPPVSTTVNNVTNLIMGLNAPPSQANVPPPPVVDDSGATWARGRRPRDISPVSNYGKSSRRGLSSNSQPNLLDRWPEPPSSRAPSRAISPSSTRSGRPLGSSASSMSSGNWRSSMSTTSSAGTSTSAFTRYSNSSTRSISTTATSVSAASWRTSVKQPSISSNSSGHSASGGYTSIPKNIKLMNGVPWELDQLPRGQHPDPLFGSPPAPRKQRTRKPKDMKLDTITERPPNSAGPKSPAHLRKDAMTSTSDLTTDVNGSKDEGDIGGTGGVKKVHKGQINALAKMLSALRR